MLVLCNKIDAMPDDLAGIEAKKMVRKRLETEVESLRVSRASGLGETDASAVRVELEIAGSNFRSLLVAHRLLNTLRMTFARGRVKLHLTHPCKQVVGFSPRCGIRGLFDQDGRWHGRPSRLDRSARVIQ
jgi:hypothetical protein